MELLRTLLRRAWYEDHGVLSFEWTLVITLLVIGIVGGLAGVRDAIIDELGDIAEATLSLDQTFTLAGIPEKEIEPIRYSDKPGGGHDRGRNRVQGQRSSYHDP